MNTQLDEILQQLSAGGAIALKDLLLLFMRASKVVGYYAATPEESKNIRKLLRDIPDVELGVLLFKIGPEFGSARTFFQVEGQRRHGQILEWVYRGILPDLTPDLVLITVSANSGEEPKP